MSSTLKLLNIIPSSLRNSQQRELYIAIYAHYSAQLALQEIEPILLESHDKEEDSLSAEKRFRIFSLAWTAVENLDLLRQTIRKSKDFLAPAFKDRDLFANLELARQLRNDKSHIANNFSNISKRGVQFPNLGLLKCYLYDPKPSHEFGLYIYIISLDPLINRLEGGKNSQIKFDVRDGAAGDLAIRRFSFALQTQRGAFNITQTVEIAERIFAKFFDDFSNALSNLPYDDVPAIALNPPLFIRVKADR